MSRLVEIVSNSDGKLSRTQCAIVFLLLFSVCLIVAHIVQTGVVLSYVVMAALAFLHIYVLLDRVDARRIDLKISKEGAHVSLGRNSDGEVDSRAAGGGISDGGVGNP